MFTDNSAYLDHYNIHKTSTVELNNEDLMNNISSLTNNTNIQSIKITIASLVYQRVNISHKIIECTANNNSIDLIRNVLVIDLIMDFLQFNTNILETLNHELKLNIMQLSNNITIKH